MPESTRVLSRALRDWLLQTPWEFFVTIQTNTQLSEQACFSKVRRFGAVVDRYWLGRGWAKKPSAERTQFRAVIERASSVHFHLLLNRPPSAIRHDDWRDSPETLSHVFTHIGRRAGVCPRGDIKVVPILSDESNSVRVTRYSLKDLNTPGKYVILSEEFHAAVR